jgi:hypothetical protein
MNGFNIPTASQPAGHGTAPITGFSGGNLGQFPSSTENQIQTTHAQSAPPGKQDRNLRVGKRTTVSKNTGKPAPAGGKKKGEKVSPPPRPQ